MGKYRKRPVIVDAEQWFPGKEVRGVQHFKPVGVDIHIANEAWFVETIHNQRAWLAPGDWVIMEPDGIHFYPCKPDVFQAVYEPCE